MPFLQKKHDKNTENNTQTFSAILIVTVVIQFIYSPCLLNWVKNYNIRNCKYWQLLTIVTSIIYVTCVASGVAGHFPGTGYTMIVVFTIFKVYELAAVYAFIKDIERHGIPITSVASPISPMTQSEIVLSYVVATDLPPSYIETQNCLEWVEPPPPFYEDVLKST
ncbi:unnamed protein product [Orchesella dallaii]|uniref:Uncharacterized protein n=1 Tax=Orchesella dallaii TaxID=48710 RepID=A0ABP1PZR0_9HEXA